MSSIGIAELITIAAGATATYRSVKRTYSPPERFFAIWVNVACWIFTFGFLLGIRFIPKSFLLWYCGTSAVMMVSGFGWWTTKQRQIREAESHEGTLARRSVKPLTQLSSLALALFVIAVSVVIVSAARSDAIPQDVSQRNLPISVIFLIGSCISFLLHRKLGRKK